MLHIAECEVKWALGRITRSKDSEDDGIPAELLQILKDDAVKLLHSICQKIWKIHQWPQVWKKSILILIPKKNSIEECSNHWANALFFHASKIMLKILQHTL